MPDYLLDLIGWVVLFVLLFVVLRRFQSGKTKDKSDPE